MTTNRTGHNRYRHRLLRSATQRRPAASYRMCLQAIARLPFVRLIAAPPVLAQGEPGWQVEGLDRLLSRVRLLHARSGAGRSRHTPLLKATAARLRPGRLTGS
jgi:hypothetical protein